MVKGRKRVLKVCPNCGSTSVRPVKELDEWASIEEQMDSAGGDKFECDECGYKGELIGVAEAPDAEELNEEEDELVKPKQLKAEKEARENEEKIDKEEKSKTVKAKSTKKAKNALKKAPKTVKKAAKKKKGR